MAWDINFKTDRPFREIDIIRALEAMPPEYSPANSQPTRTIWGWRMLVDVVFDDEIGDLIVSGEDEDMALGSEFANRLAAELRTMHYNVLFDESQPTPAIYRT